MNNNDIPCVRENTAENPEMEEWKRELMEVVQRAAQEEYEKERQAILMEQRVFATNEAEHCQYQDSFDRYL